MKLVNNININYNYYVLRMFWLEVFNLDDAEEDTWKIYLSHH